MKTKIIHLPIFKDNIVHKYDRFEVIRIPYYRCNQAIISNPNKITTKFKNVTCKNCIKWFIKK